MKATPALGTNERAPERKRRRALSEAPGEVRYIEESRRADCTPEQFRESRYNDPPASRAWMRPYYICGCGYDELLPLTDKFERVTPPHRCTLRGAPEWDPMQR